MGAGHSFSPLCVTDGSLINLDALTGIIAFDPPSGDVTVAAGTRLHALGAPLWALGRSLLNQGDVDQQSVAGACGTSTHGTGMSLGSFSSAVTGLRLVTVAGHVIDADAVSHPDVFRAAQTSLGALGVLTQVRLQTAAAYHLHEHERVMPNDALMAALPQAITAHRHFECFLFPKAGLGIAKTLDPCPPEAVPTDRALPIDAILNLSARIAHGLPGSDRLMQRAILALHSDPDRRGPAWRIFPSPRDCRFNEMEYEIPLAAGPDCLREIVEVLGRSPICQFIPVEFRTVAADESWLSPFYQRDSASISIHQYHRVDHRPLFDLIEPIFWKYEGRPHWGKLHSLDAQRLRPLYPQWDAFQAVRRQLDPDDRLMNPYLRTLLGA